MLDALRSKVREEQARLDSLDRERLLLATAIAAYEDALKIVSADMGTASSTPVSIEDAVKRGRRPPADWQKTMQVVANKHPTPFSIDDLIEAARGHQFHPTRGNVRSQMHAYGSRDLIQRVSDGVFQMTAKGFIELDIVAPEPAPDTDDDAYDWDAALEALMQSEAPRDDEDQDPMAD